MYSLTGDETEYHLGLGIVTITNENCREQHSYLKKNKCGMNEFAGHGL